MSKRYSYRNLIVWQKAQDLVVDVVKLVENAPKTWANAVIVRQIVSSATSISANIAEGHGRYASGAHRNHLSIARGSAAETDSWANTIMRLDWITVDEEQQLHKQCNEIIAILSSKMIKLEQEHNKNRTISDQSAEYNVEHNLPFPFEETDFA
ncbi:MAG: four helix bundle protein [Herpetosiphon sp.]|nr:four helix bundle protein [Herpetosiphon sp.]